MAAEPALTLAVYLLLHRDKAFRKSLLRLTIWSLSVLTGCWTVSAMRQGYLFRYLKDQWAALLQTGYYGGLLYWLTALNTMYEGRNFDGIRRFLTELKGQNRTRIHNEEYNLTRDMDEILSRPISNDREYGEEEIWNNFKYFMDRALPVCEEAGVKLALHPNDPPVPSLGGVHSLIWNTDCYKRAFAMVENSPYLTMKMCIGCWLESETLASMPWMTPKLSSGGENFLCSFPHVSSVMHLFGQRSGRRICRKVCYMNRFIHLRIQRIP